MSFYIYAFFAFVAYISVFCICTFFLFAFFCICAYFAFLNLCHFLYLFFFVFVFFVPALHLLFFLLWSLCLAMAKCPFCKITEKDSKRWYKLYGICKEEKGFYVSSAITYTVRVKNSSTEPQRRQWPPDGGDEEDLFLSSSSP